VIAFDEVGWANFPGETTALKEILGFDRYALRRFPINPRPSYIISSRGNLDVVLRRARRSRHALFAYAGGGSGQHVI
jgi:hypothetical protein